MTENHDYTQPSAGTDDWHIPLNDNFSKIDTDVEIRGKNNERSSYTPKSGAKYLATDTGDIYLGDGTDWTHFGNVANNESTARLSNSVDQTISNSTWTTVGFNTVDWDSGSLASTSNNTITVDETGIYFVYAVWQYSSAINDGTRVIANININGSRPMSVADGDVVGGSQKVRLAPSGIVELTSGDVVKFQTWHNHGSGLDIVGNTPYFGLARITAGGGSGSSGTDVIASPNHRVHYSELVDGAAISSPITIPPNETLTVKAWGAVDTNGNTPNGLSVALVDPSGSDVAAENTTWTTSENGIVSYHNTSASLEIAVLEIRNNTGSDYADPNGVGGRIGYEVR